MDEQTPSEPPATPVITKRAGSSFSSKAARYSFIAPLICWFPLLLVAGSKGDLYGMEAVFGLLLLVSFTSFLAGFVGLFAGKALDVIMAILGILLSGSFCFYDSLG
ncbi:MAG TPA: hypothetical protein VGI88_12920, partial [Verrucomicrobiae bacterium]